MRRLVMYDWKNGVLRAWPRYLLSGILMVLLCMAQMRQAREGVKTGLYSGPSFGNYLAVWLKGMREPQGIAKIRHLKLPAEWLALQLGHAFVLAGYARADLDRNGRSLVLRAAGRTAWWDAKCIWAAMGTAVYYLMFYGIVAAASYLSGVIGAGGSMSVIPASRIWVSDFACPGHLVAVLSVFVFLPLTGLCAVSGAGRDCRLPADGPCRDLRLSVCCFVLEPSVSFGKLCHAVPPGRAGRF